MKLLFSPTSPYVRKCLVVAHELGLASRIELVRSQAHPVQRDREIIPFNPLGKVPTLIADGGLVLYDSRVICEYLNDLAQGGLLPSDGAARWQALTVQSLGDGILDAALLARYEDAARPETSRWPEWRSGQLDKVETSLHHLEERPALIQRIDLGSIAVGCALWYLDLRFAELTWRDRFPVLAHWHAAFSQRPSMQAI
jgi:glutathione S-transferase